MQREELNNEALPVLAELRQHRHLRQDVLRQRRLALLAVARIRIVGGDCPRRRCFLSYRGKHVESARRFFVQDGFLFRKYGIDQDNIRDFVDKTLREIWCVADYSGREGLPLIFNAT